MTYEPTAERAVLEVLYDMQALLTHGWCQGAEARTECGDRTDAEDDEAPVTWSLNGALTRAIAHYPSYKMPGEEAGFDEVLDRVQSAVLVETGGLDIDDWNDDPLRIHKEVLDCVGDAIGKSYLAATMGDDSE